MPRFRVRLNQPGTDEFRISYVSFETADQARAWAEKREREFVAFKITEPNPDFTGDLSDDGPPPEIPISDKALARRAKLPKDDPEHLPKNQVLLHQLSEPYEVAYVEERGPIVPEQKRHLKGK